MTYRADLKVAVLWSVVVSAESAVVWVMVESAFSKIRFSGRGSESVLPLRGFPKSGVLPWKTGTPRVARTGGSGGL